MMLLHKAGSLVIDGGGTPEAHHSSGVLKAGHFKIYILSTGILFLDMNVLLYHLSQNVGNTNDWSS